MSGRMLLASLLGRIAVPARAFTTVIKGTDASKHMLRGQIVTAKGNVLNGELVIEGDMITLCRR